MEKTLIILDVEGPQVLNDNAQELIVHLAKEFPSWENVRHWLVIRPEEKEKHMTLGEIIGTRFFARISNIDDIWGDFHRILQDPAYSSGHTLKVILPFMKALGATYRSLYEFSQQSLRLVSNVKSVIAELNEHCNVWMVSTSYEFFIRAYCDFIGFPFERAYCTKVDQRDFDGLTINRDESYWLLEFMKQVAAMPIIKYNEKTGEVIPEHQEYYGQITSFIWDRVYNIPVGKLLRIVHPVGQTQKREAAEKILSDTAIPLSKTMGVGDSQTDLQIAQLLRDEGLMVMFNGKGKVCGQSGIMCIGEDANTVREVAHRFSEYGREETIRYYTSSSRGEGIHAVTPENINELEQLSVKKRKEFRGVHIGELT
ncbi:MAG: hypothetical protein LUQ65_05040 [Candidatus Helarchaeota archaeon]|nr:hypothetical protein [Candidatus Helarchaeota archaeon]